MENTTNRSLETEKIGSLMRKYAIPCVISVWVLRKTWEFFEGLRRNLLSFVEY